MARSKGNKGEREVVGLIEPWWCKVEPEAKFARTPGSGGWLGQAGVNIRAEFQVSGDLMTTAKQFPFCVEVKRQEGWTVLNIERVTGLPWDWWRQTQRSAAEVKRVPMLWMRKNRQPWFVWLPLSFAERYPLPPPVYTWGDEIKRTDYGDHIPVIFDAVDILEKDPKCFLALTSA